MMFDFDVVKLHIGWDFLWAENNEPPEYLKRRIKEIVENRLLYVKRADKIEEMKCIDMCVEERIGTTLHLAYFMEKDTIFVYGITFGIFKEIPPTPE